MEASNIYEFIKQLKYQLNDLKTVKTNLMNTLCVNIRIRNNLLEKAYRVGFIQNIKKYEGIWNDVESRFVWLYSYESVVRSLGLEIEFSIKIYTSAESQ